MAASSARRRARAQRFSGLLPAVLLAVLPSCLLACLFSLLPASLPASFPAFLPGFRLCGQPAVPGRAEARPAEARSAEAGLAELSLPSHALQRQGLVRQSTAGQEAGWQPGLLPLAVPGGDILAMPPEPALAEARARLVAQPSFPVKALMDLLRDVPAVRLAGTPERGRALLVAFTRRDCPACRTLGAMLDGIAPELDFPVGLVPAGSASQARTFYQAPAGRLDGRAGSAGPAVLEALADLEPARVRSFVAQYGQAPRLPLLCWAAGGRARLASLAFRDVQALIWLLKQDPACFGEKK